MTAKLRVLDLFSGIGGFSLGLHRAGGFETVAFCEIDPFCRRVLAKHWPEVPIYDDIRSLSAATLAADGIAADVICGGFPCQDLSLAGRGKGLDGAKSGLWREFERLIAELEPAYVIIENSPVLRSRGLDALLSSLATIGYDAEWHCLPVNALGAPHRRDRVWIVAYAAGFGDRLPPVEVSARGHLAEHGDWWACEPQICRVDDGTPGRVDRLKALGNAVVPQIPELIGRAILQAQREAA